MNTTPEQIADLTKAHTDAHQDLLDFSNSLENRISVKERQVDQAISDLTVLGDGSQGSTVINAASYFSSAGTEAYLHFKLPLKTNKDSEMMHLHIRGYSYGESKVVDATCVGYCYAPDNNIRNHQTVGTHQPTWYRGTDNSVYLRLYFASTYYLTVTVDTTRVGNGRLFRRGDIEIIRSTSNSL